MRITHSMMTGTFLANLNRTLSRMGTQQSQLASNRRITRLSDDPIGTINALAIRKKLNRLEQYQKNVSDAQAWLTQSETALSDINEVLKSAYEQAIEASNDTMAQVDRDAVASYIEQLRDHLFQTGNSTFGDKYIFGGNNTTTTPFTYAADGTVLYNSVDLGHPTPADLSLLGSQSPSFGIGPGKTIRVSLTGIEVMGHGADNLFQVFDGLISSLRSGDTAGISAGAGTISRKQNDLLSRMADIGGQTNRLEFVTSRYELDRINTRMVQSEIEDIDTAEVIMQYKTAESVYMAALSTGSKIIQPSLLDFLR
ncbi:MAG: flagellar hook-associated protein FlgL [Clostridiaceae bacterium]|nr:flagellar hook-associated protein FlgL [Clostridiaceae bacterium]